MRCDAIVLAGGRATDEMAKLTGTPLRGLFPWRGRSFVSWVVDALRASHYVDRIAVIGPPELKDQLDLVAADLLLEELDSVNANIFASIKALSSVQPVYITASDNPLLTARMLDDFFSRIPGDAQIAYPALRHEDFLKRFPDATNIPIKLRDGAWMGGLCIWADNRALPGLRTSIDNVLASRKSVWKMVRLLGPLFIARFALHLATSNEVERRASKIAGVPLRFIQNCDPVFSIDIDDPVDWIYLHDHCGKEPTN